MRAIGKIGDVQLAFQKEKENQDGSKYWGERYTIFFENGDDIHMIDSGWLHCQGKDGGRAILERRGIKTGAVGEALFRYGFRDWQGKRFSECELTKFTPLQQGNGTQAPPTASPESTKPADVAAEFAQAAQTEQAQEAKTECSDLPF